MEFNPAAKGILNACNKELVVKDSILYLLCSNLQACIPPDKNPLKRDLKEQYYLVVLDLTLLINLPSSCSFCEFLNFFYQYYSI